LKHRSHSLFFELILLSALDPGKQGLKHFFPPASSPQSELSALDPGKQGLKHIKRTPHTVKTSLSALDPGKQGLKPAPGASVIEDFNIFQRLIQENKD